jgi:hypothetical protein
MLMKMRLQLSLAALAATLAWTASSHAATLVRDTWQDGTRTDPASPIYSENGVDADLDTDLESAWFRSGSNSTTAMSTGHMVNSPGAGSSMTLVTYFTPDATPVTLSNVGDNMVVTWVFTPNGVTTTSTGNQDMRIALVDSPLAARVSTDATPGSNSYTGYGAFFNMRAGTLGNSSPFRIMEWAGPANNLLSSAGAYGQVATAAAVVGTTPGYASGTEYTFSMSLTKTVAGLDIVQTMSGGDLNGSGTLSVSYSDASPQPLTFDTFSVRPQTPELAATSFDTTLFQVTFTPGVVPEPASAVLACFGGIAVLALRRRR